MIEENELEKQNSLEITGVQEITEDDIEQIQQLLEKQREEMLPKKGDVNYFNGRDHSVLMGQGLKMANLVEYGTYEGFMNKALEEGKLVGFGIVAFDEKGKVIGTFTGVDWDHKGKGIGVQLLIKRHEELKQRGITQYQASVWDGSIKMFNRSGVLYKLSDDECGNRIATIYL